MPLLHGGIFRIGFSLAFFDIVQSLVAYGGKPHPENSPMQKSYSLLYNKHYNFELVIRTKM